jgi:hypothetical protein
MPAYTANNASDGVDGERPGFTAELRRITARISINGVSPSHYCIQGEQEGHRVGLCDEVKQT